MSDPRWIRVLLGVVDHGDRIVAALAGGLAVGTLALWRRRR